MREGDTITVRPATVEDAAGIARVHVDSWRFAYRGLLPQALLDALSVEARTRLWQHGVANPLPRWVTIVAVRDDRIVGFCSCGASREPDAAVTQGEIGAIYVDPATTRRGIGGLLMDGALSHLARQGFTDAVLWVLDGNRIGQGFYEGYGWQPAGTTKSETIGGIEVTEIQYRIDIPHA